jgi:hypothetical protein
MAKNHERRLRRSANITEALNLQLAACCAGGRIEAMVLADGDGLALAASGDGYACDEIAGRMVRAGTRAGDFAGVIYGATQAWGVEMRRIHAGGDELYLCAVGGEPAVRRQQIDRSAGGVTRILGS